MSAPWIPPRASYHLKVFGVSLVLVVTALAFFLFAVQMEALTPAAGTVSARDLQEIRALIPGLVEAGWYEAGLAQPDGSQLSVRLDGQGNGMTEPAAGKKQTVLQYRLEDGRRIADKAVHFHRLQAGDELWPGQVVAAIRTDELRARLRDLENHDDADLFQDRYVRQRERVRLLSQLAQAALWVPAGEDRWLAVEVRAAPNQAVQAGDVLAVIVPIDAAARQPRDLIAVLDVEEDRFGDVRVDQDVRICSGVFNQRLFGVATGKIERVAPLANVDGNGKRHFQVQAVVTQAPFAMPLGSTVKAEIVVGRKTVYRIILEH